MNRRNFLLAFVGVAAGGAALSSQARAAPAQTLWDDLHNLETAGTPAEDLPAEGASEAQQRRRRGAPGRGRGRRAYPARRYGGRRPRGRAYGYYAQPRRRRRRRVCRLVRDRWGYVVRRCWWVW